MLSFREEFFRVFFSCNAKKKNSFKLYYKSTMNFFIFTNVPRKKTMKDNILFRYSFRDILYIHLEQRFNPEQKINIEIS